MQNTYSTAPAVLKLYGEHAVVRGILSAAIAVKLYAKAELQESSSNSFTISLSELHSAKSFSDADLLSLFGKYKKSLEKDTNNKDKLNEFVNDIIKEGFNKDILPFAVIAGRIINDYKCSLSEKIVKISSEIPMSKGFASSAACATAFTLTLINALNIDISPNIIIDVARDGERITHKNDGAGKIDVNTSFYGGCIVYSDSTGVKKENLSEDIKIIAVDTGPKKPTSETVGIVNNKLIADYEGTLEIFRHIEECTKIGVNALKKGDLKTAGEEMYEDQRLLGLLGVSSPNLEKAVSIAKQNNAYGAKLSGGGGGGVAIAIAEEPQSLMKKFNDAGFNTYLVNISKEGAKASSFTKKRKEKAF